MAIDSLKNKGAHNVILYFINNDMQNMQNTELY